MCWNQHTFFQGERMEWWSGDIVLLSNENYLDHLKENNGQRRLDLIDRRGHPAVVIAGAESWGDKLPSNVYIVAKGQTFDPTCPDFDLFDQDIKSGIALELQIPREEDSTYMFSGELYIVDMNNTEELSPQIKTWKEIENPIPLMVSNNDMLCLTTCILKAQEPMLSEHGRLRDIISNTFLEASKRVDTNTFVHEELERIYPIITSNTQVIYQYVHYNYTDKILTYNSFSPFNDHNQVSDTLYSMELSASNEFNILEQKSISGVITSQEETIHNRFKQINDRNNELSQHNYFDLDINI